MSRTLRLVLPLAMLALALTSASRADAQPTTSPERPPNIVVIYIDDMGFGDPGVYGNPECPTPNIDRLASERIRFDRWYTNSPICSPSRTALMTGQSPQRWAVHSFINDRGANERRQMANWLDPQATVLPRLMKDRGYATAHFGKWHMGGGRNVGEAPLSTEYGIDEQLHSFEGLGDRILLKGEGLSDASARLGRGEITWIDKGEATGIYVDRSIDFIRRHQQEPFYLHFWPGDIHDPFRPTPAQLEANPVEGKSEEWTKFFAVLTDLDKQVGRLVDAIDEMGLGENTLVIFTSDNGPTAWPHYYNGGKGAGAAPGYTDGLRGRKWSLYEGGIRMPFIARMPGTIEPGQVNDTTIGAMYDLLPTFAALCDLKLPDDYASDGENLLPQLLGKSDANREDPIFFEYNSFGGTDLTPFLPHDKSPTLLMMDGDLKLLMEPDGSDLQLYDIGSDRPEEHDLAAERPDVVERMKSALSDWYAEVAEDGRETRQRLAERADG